MGVEIKFIGHSLMDIPSLKPVMDYMNVKDIYAADYGSIGEESACKFELVGKNLEEVGKDDLVVGAWGPLMRDMFKMGYKNFVFMPHGVVNFCPCLQDSTIRDRYELVVGDFQKRIREWKGPDKVFAVGYPKIDEFGKHPEVDHTLREEILGNDKPTILWAPPGHESYVEEIMPIVKKLKEEVDVNVILKLHAGGRCYPLYRNKLKSGLVRVVWDDEYTTSPLMRIADVLLSGHTSVAFEFVLCDRPIIACALAPSARMGRYNATIDEHRDAVQLEKEELVENLIGAIDGPGRFVDMKNRLAFRNDLFENIGCATAAAAEKLQEIAGEIG